MIFSTFLGLVLLLIFAVTAPLRLLPDVVLSPNIAGAISTANSYLAALNVVVPISTLAAVLTIILIVEGSIFSYKIIMWVIRKIPTIN